MGKATGIMDSSTQLAELDRPDSGYVAQIEEVFAPSVEASSAVDWRAVLEECRNNVQGKLFRSRPLLRSVCKVLGWMDVGLDNDTCTARTRLEASLVLKLGEVLFQHAKYPEQMVHIITPMREECSGLRATVNEVLSACSFSSVQ
jgi:hypothetical protein